MPSRKLINKEDLVGLGTKNFYEIVPKKYLQSSINYANKAKMNINLPARIAVVGASGSCKTNWLINFIELVDSFDTVTIYAKNTEETLYAFLIDALKVANIPCSVFNDLSNVIPCDQYNKNKNNLVIFDDFNNASTKELEPVKDIYTMGRKSGITSVYIAQKYHSIPIVVRSNINYLVIFKISTKNDLARVIVRQFIRYRFRSGLRDAQVY